MNNSMQDRSLSQGQSIALLIVTTVVWGTTFPLIKDAIASLSPETLMAGRFLVAMLVVLPFCRGWKQQVMVDGAVLGGIAFAAYFTQGVGLETTSANRGAFITSLNVILVPLIGGLWMRHHLSVRVLLAAIIALLGIGIMSWEGGALVVGDLWMFGCAFTYAAYILLMETATRRSDPIALTTVQLVTIALLGLAWSLPNLGAQLPAIRANWGVLLYLRGGCNGTANVDTGDRPALPLRF